MSQVSACSWVISFAGCPALGLPYTDRNPGLGDFNIVLAPGLKPRTMFPASSWSWDSDSQSPALGVFSGTRVRKYRREESTPPSEKGLRRVVGARDPELIWKQRYHQELGPVCCDSYRYE